MTARYAGLRKLGRYLFLSFLLLLLVISGLLWYTTTKSFQQMVRGRLITAIERATGGRVEIGSFHVVSLRFEVELRDLTIHGRETKGAPYMHVDRMLATVNLSYVLGARIGFRSLTLEHPLIHLIVYPDGSTNQPTPKQQGGVDFARLFSISIDRLEVRRGELIWQDQTIPLDFGANEVSAGLDYSFFHRRYSGSLVVGRAETLFDGYRPVPWTGRADFAIGESGIEVHSLQANSLDSVIRGNGLVANFRSPVFKGKYSLNLDVQQLGAIMRQPELKRGSINIAGEGTWSAQNFSSAGTFDLRDFFGDNGSIAIKSASAAGKFTLDPKKISLSQVAGRVLGGSFTSDAELIGWRTGKAGGVEPRGRLRLKLKDGSLAELLAGLGPTFRPVNQLKFAGNISGTSEIRWKQTLRNGEASFALEVVPPGKVIPGQVPLKASVEGGFKWPSRELELANLTASSPSTQIQASGAMTSSSSMRISFSTSNPDEWRPLIAAVFPSGLPLEVRDRATFNGTINGRVPDVAIAGNLQVQNFDTLLPATAHTRAERYHWDSFAADVQGSSTSLIIRNAALNRGESSVKFSGNTELKAWSLPDDGSFGLQMELQGGDAAEIARLAGFQHQVAGRLDAHFQVSGTRSRPRGNGNFLLANGSLDGHKYDSASGDVEISGSKATFRNIRVLRGASTIRADGTYDVSSRAFEFTFAGNDFDLAQDAPLEGLRIKVGGKVDFTAHLAGTPALPQLNANIHLKTVSLNEEVLGDLLLDVESHGQDLRLNGRSNFKNSELFVDGDVQLREQWPARIDLRFTHLDIDSLLETYLRTHVTGHSAVAGSLQIRGPLRSPQLMTVVGNLTGVEAELAKIKLHNEGPIHFEINDRVLKIERLHLAGDNTDMFAAGSVALAGERTLNLEAQGKADLKLIETYDPDFSASGEISGNGTVTGTLDAPLVKGKLQIEDGGISDINLPSALSEINGTLSFSQNQVTIDSLTAKTGGGTVAFTGHAELAEKQVNFDLTASANAVRLRYPPGVSSTANAEVHWAGSTAGSLLSGNVTVIKLGATPGFDFGSYLQRASQVSSLPQTDPVLNKIRLDLHLVTAPELQMQTSIIRLQGDADLRIRGNAAKPVIVGRADILEGEASFNGTKYRLERGGVTFNNPAVTTPFLDLEATTRVRDYEVTLSLSGELDKPKINYRSEPPLPTSDIIALLAFGQTTEESAQMQQTSQSAFNQQASNAMLAAALNATLSNRTQRLFGVSRIKIDPQGLATETSPTQTGPAVTIEQQVKDNLTITYTTNVAQASQQIIRAEYNVSRNVSVVAIRDQNGVVSFDVKIRRRKR